MTKVASNFTVWSLEILEFFHGTSLDTLSITFDKFIGTVGSMHRLHGSWTFGQTGKVLPWSWTLHKMLLSAVVVSWLYGQMVSIFFLIECMIHTWLFFLVSRENFLVKIEIYITHFYNLQKKNHCLTCLATSSSCD